MTLLKSPRLGFGRNQAINYPARWGLVEHWALNEASGVAVASVSSANNLTDNNTVTTAAGKVYAAARQFTAANSESLSLADNAALSTGNVDFLVAEWLWLDTKPANNMIAVYKGGAGATDEYGLFWDNVSDRFKFEIQDNAAAYPAATANTFGAPSTATWYLIVAGRDGTDLFISVNGGAFDTQTLGAGIPVDRAGAFVLGAYAATKYWNGRQGPLAFFKSPPIGMTTARTEIRDRLWNGGSGRPYPWR